ncbi:MAG TPA: hypothetical protein DCY35_03740 [Prolixibacteraceae bacterium]|nr:hypothetical protein [Prolixibacteraceae bacterium]
MTTNRKSEGEILSDIRWQGNTIANDRDVIQAKGISGLNRSHAYAVAISNSQKLEIWFRSKERLRAWEKTIDKKQFKIKIINHEK